MNTELILSLVVAAVTVAYTINYSTPSDTTEEQVVYYLKMVSKALAEK